MSQVLSVLPSHRVQLGGGWRVTDYQTGRALLEHPACTARPPLADHLLKRGNQPGLETSQALLAAVGQQLLFADPATHQRLRAALDGPLARYSARLTPFIRQTVVALLDAARQRGEIDLEADFAAPLAIRTLTTLLGWPDASGDVARYAAWSAALADLTTGHQMGQALPRVQEMAAAFRTLVTAKCATPADDLASVVAVSSAFASETERVITLMTVFGAGTSTTITALVNGLPLLLNDPARLEVLRAALAADRATLSRLVEDLLRRVSPTQYVRRWTTAEVMAENHPLPAGCPVQIELAAMNQDQTCFPAPETLDWQRPAQPAQASFGFGPHACPGAPLARVELRLALAALLSIPSLRLVGQPTGWSTNQNQLRAHGVRVAFR